MVKIVTDKDFEKYNFRRRKAYCVWQGSLHNPSNANNSTIDLNKLDGIEDYRGCVMNIAWVEGVAQQMKYTVIFTPLGVTENSELLTQNSNFHVTTDEFRSGYKPLDNLFLRNTNGGRPQDSRAYYYYDPFVIAFNENCTSLGFYVDPNANITIVSVFVYF